MQKMRSSCYFIRGTHPCSWWAQFFLSPNGAVSVVSDYGNYGFVWQSRGEGVSIEEFILKLDKGYVLSKFGMGQQNEYWDKEKSELNYKSALKELLYAHEISDKDFSKYTEEIETVFEENNTYSDVIHAITDDSYNLDTVLNKHFDFIEEGMHFDYPPDIKNFVEYVWPVFIEELKNTQREGIWGKFILSIKALSCKVKLLKRQ